MSYPQFKSVRDWYNRQVQEISRLDQAWKKAGLSAKERACRANHIRHQTRIRARSMMRNAHEVQKLRERDLRKYGNPNGPTFRQLVNQQVKRGVKSNQVYENIVKSSQRTDKNRSSVGSLKENIRDRVKARMYNRALYPKNMNWRNSSEVKDFLKERSKEPNRRSNTANATQSKSHTNNATQSKSHAKKQPPPPPPQQSQKRGR